MSLVGNLATMGLEEILQWVSLGNKSGTLVLGHDGEKRQLVFEDGALVGVLSSRDAPSDAPPDAQAAAQPGDPATSPSHAPSDPRSSAPSTPPSGPRSSTQSNTQSSTWSSPQPAPLPSADLTPEARRRELKSRAERSVADLLRWPSGDFQFLVGERPSGFEPAIALPATALLLNAAQRLDETTAAADDAHEGGMLWGATAAATGSPIVLPGATPAERFGRRATDRPHTPDPEAPPGRVGLDTTDGIAPESAASVAASEPAAPVIEFFVEEPELELAAGTVVLENPVFPRGAELGDLHLPTDSAPPPAVPLFAAQSIRRRPVGAYVVLGLGVIALCASVALIATLARRSTLEATSDAEDGATQNELAAGLVARVDARTEEMEAELREQYSAEIDRLRRELELERRAPSGSAAPTVERRAIAGRPTPGRTPATQAPVVAAPPIDGSLRPAAAPLLAARLQNDRRERPRDAFEIPRSGAPIAPDPDPPTLDAGAVELDAATAALSFPPPPGPSVEPDTSGSGAPEISATVESSGTGLARVLADPPTPRDRPDVDRASDVPPSEPATAHGAPAEARLAKAIALSPSTESVLAPLVPEDLVANEATIVEPVLLRKPTPRYPVRARRQNQRAQIGVQILVSSSGRASDVALAADPVGHGFDESALAAARKTRWEPARDETGEPVALWVNLLYEFSP